MITGDDVVHEIAIAAPPEAVYAMFVEPARLVRWIGISADLEPVVGGRFRFEIAARAATSSSTRRTGCGSPGVGPTRRRVSGPAARPSR